MRLAAETALVLASVAAAGVAGAFVPAVPTAFRSSSTAATETSTSSSPSSPLRMGNVLEGKDIPGEFEPINNMILVRKAEVIEETGGGIILTGKAKIQKSEGAVVSAGPGRTDLETGFRSPMPVSPGESVLFGKYDGTEVTYNGERHTLIRDDDVLVKFPADAGGDLDLGAAEVLWDAVLVRVPEADEEEDAASAGILIAKSSAAKKKSSVGEAVKVGPGRYARNGVLMEMDVRPGDMIKFRDFAAQEVLIGDEEFAVVRMTDILAKF